MVSWWVFTGPFRGPPTHAHLLRRGKMPEIGLIPRPLHSSPCDSIPTVALGGLFTKAEPPGVTLPVSVASPHAVVVPGAILAFISGCGRSEYKMHAHRRSPDLIKKPLLYAMHLPSMPIVTATPAEQYDQHDDENNRSSIHGNFLPLLY